MIDRSPGAAPSSQGKQQFNVYLPPALIRAVKYRALDDQTSLSDLVERALVAFLESGGKHA